MSRPTPVPDPDLDAEREVDLRSVWERIAARWWLPVLGTVLGLVAGFLLALGGGKVYEAETLIAMGQPFSPNGGAPVQSFLTNARAVSEIVRSESALEKAARASGLRVGALRGNVTSQIVGASGPGARPTGAPLVTITVVAAQPLRAEKAADALGQEVITRTSAQYVDTKIEAFNDQLGSIQEQLNTLVPRIAQLEEAVEEPGLSSLDKLVLVSSLDNAQARRGQLLDLQSDVQQQLALAENVEKAQVVEPAAAVRTTARSGRNSALVGGLIGLCSAAPRPCSPTRSSRAAPGRPSCSYSRRRAPAVARVAPRSRRALARSARADGAWSRRSGLGQPAPHESLLRLLARHRPPLETHDR